MPDTRDPGTRFLHGTLRDRLSVNGQVAVALTHISVTVTRCGPAIQGGKRQTGTNRALASGGWGYSPDRV